MSEMVLNTTALPQIFFEIYPEGQVLVRIDGKTITLQPAGAQKRPETEEAAQTFPWLGLLAPLPRTGDLPPSEDFARRKREEKELEL